jgi:hypothetical protein
MKKVNVQYIFGTAVTSAMMLLFAACSQGPNSGATDQTPTVKKHDASEALKGIGEIMHVELNNPLKEDMVSRGKADYEMKCSSCHRLSTEKLVGPGWEGVTNRRTPEWIMNMITNTDVMLDKDPEAQKLLETCLVRMPNQNLSIGDCRDILEFMLKNDKKK